MPSKGQGRNQKNAKANAKAVAKRPASDIDQTPSKKVKVDDLIEAESGGGEVPSTPSTPNSQAMVCAYMVWLLQFRSHTLSSMIAYRIWTPQCVQMAPLGSGETHLNILASG